MMANYFDMGQLDDAVAGVTGSMLLPQARKKVSAGNTLSNNTDAPPVLPMSMRARLGKVSQELDALDTAEPDLSDWQSYAKQRGQEGEGAMINALAAQFAGPQFEGLQAQLLKKAAAAQDPMKLGNALMTPSGQIIKDPYAARDMRRAALERQYGGLLSAIERQDKDERDRADRMAQQDFMNQYRTDQANAQRNWQNESLALRREMLNNRGEPGNFAPSGFTADGQQVVTNSKTGMSYIIGMGPNGQPTYTPHMGAMIPKATFEKNVEAARTFGAKADSADALIRQVDATPEAFGLKAAAVSKLPAPIQGRVGAMVMDDRTLKLRADVLRQAAMEISDIYGAAQSIGEAARAATFIPNPEDPPAVVIEKLRAARDYARSNAGALGGAANRAAQARSGAPAPAATGGLSADEQAEYERLKKKYGR